MNTSSNWIPVPFPEIRAVSDRYRAVSPLIARPCRFGRAEVPARLVPIRCCRDHGPSIVPNEPLATSTPGRRCCRKSDCSSGAPPTSAPSGELIDTPSVGDCGGPGGVGADQVALDGQGSRRHRRKP